MARPDVASEQAYLDHAYDCLDRMRDALVRAGDAVVDDVAGEAMDAWNARRLQTFEDAEQGLCFGRIDVETVGDPTYVGRRLRARRGRGAGRRELAGACRPTVLHRDPRPSRTASPSAAAFVRGQDALSTSATRRSTGRRRRGPLRRRPPSWRSSSAPGKPGCGTSSRRSRRISTASSTRPVDRRWSCRAVPAPARRPSGCTGRLPAVQPPRGAAARAPRRAQPDLHGLRVARASRARRGERASNAPSASSSTASR